MTDCPILFSAPMIRALLAGNKTQTRRLIKIKPTGEILDFVKIGTNAKTGCPEFEMKGASGQHIYIPQGKHCQTPLYTAPVAVGDRLWVRENFKATGLLAFSKPSETRACGRFAYQADAEQMPRDPMISWRPSIHMPRWASRITLTVTDVRIQQLWKIDDADAIAEGIEDKGGGLGRIILANGDHSYSTPSGCFLKLWESINGAASRKANPWVLAYSFTVHHQNIDRIAA
jgi:hypothetical protein